MARNQFEVNGHTLTVSMTTLFTADKALKKAGRPSVMETFADVLERIEGELTPATIAKALRPVSIPVVVGILAALLGMTEKKALDGPLSEGLPHEWLVGLFNGLFANVPQPGDAPDTDTGGEAEGNARAA